MEENKKIIENKSSKRKDNKETFIDKKDGLKWYWILFFSFCALLFFYTISFFIFYFGFF
jgi:hypothetical protein